LDLESLYGRAEIVDPVDEAVKQIEDKRDA
jgi:hypothetical protein